MYTRQHGLLSPVPVICYKLRHDTMLADIKSAVSKKLNIDENNIKVYTSGEVYTLEGKLIGMMHWYDWRMY